MNKLAWGNYTERCFTMIGTNVNSFASFLHFSPFNFNFSSFTNAFSNQYFISISSSVAYVALLSNEILAKSSKQLSLR